MKKQASLCILGLLLSAGAQAQAVYKCVQADGRMTYQQEKCAEAVKQSTVRSPDAPADKTSAEIRLEDDRKRREKIMNERLDGNCPSPRIVEIMGDLGLCSGIPEFQERHGEAIRDWKVRNFEAYRACGRDERALKRAGNRATETAARFRGDDQGRAFHCEMFATALRTDTVKR